MIDINTCELLGTLAKTHGINGSLILRLSGFETQDIKEPDTVFIEIDGLLVPFFVESFRDLSSREIIISFRDIDSADKAAELTDFPLWIPDNCITSRLKNQLPEAEIIGYQVVDKQLGPAGTVTEMIDIVQNPLLKVFHNDREYFIPFHQDIVVGIDNVKKTILVDLPEGLFEI